MRPLARPSPYGLWMRAQTVTGVLGGFETGPPGGALHQIGDRIRVQRFAAREAVSVYGSKQRPSRNARLLQPGTQRAHWTSPRIGAIRQGHWSSLPFLVGLRPAE